MNTSLNNVHRFVALSVFLSGFSALIYEITWQRVLVRLLGGTLPAVTIVLAVFMGGLAIGAYLAAKAGDKIRDPLKLFSWLELALGAFGLLFPLLTTQSSLTFILHGASVCAQNIFHVDPIAAYATSAGGAFINTLLSLATFALLLIPTIAMGATFPLCARAVEQLAEHEFPAGSKGTPLTGDQAGEPVTDEISLLYFINLSGAAFGAVVSAFIFLPGVGVADTIRAAAAINLLTSLILLLTHRFMLMTMSPSGDEGKETAAAPPAQTPRQEQIPSRARIATMCLVAGVFSAIALALQVTWVRLFSLLFGASTYAVAAVIASCLVGLAGGSALARSFLLRHIRFRLLVSGSAALASLLLAADLIMIGHLPWWLPRMELLFAQTLPAVASYMVSRCLLIFIFTVPQSIVLGTITPFLLGRLVRHGQRTAWITGRLMFATTIGSIVGAIGAGCFVIPHTELIGMIPPLTEVSGMQNLLILASVVESLIAAAAIANVLRDAGDDERAGITVSELRQSKGLIIAIAGASGIGMALAVFHPAWNTQGLSSGVSSVPIATLLTLGEKQLRNLTTARNSLQVFYKEGFSSTVTVGKVVDKNVIYLKNDGKVEAAVPINPALAAGTSDERTQVMLGILPSIICPRKPAQTFLIGFGTGTTAGALLRNTDVEKLIVAELEPWIYTASSFFDSVNNRPLRDGWKSSGRVIAAVADARNLLALSSEPFDLIVSQPAEPWTTGSADLYSLEFWRLVKAKLQENGLFCQWLQLYAMDPNELAVVLRTFTTVFPNTVLFHAPHAGELILVGFENPEAKLDSDLLWKRLQAFPDKAVLARVGIDTSQDLLDMIVGTRDSVRTFCVTEESVTHDKRVNTDNNLITEYTFPTTVYTARDTIDKNLLALGRVTPKEITRHFGSKNDQAEALHTQSRADFAAKHYEEALSNAQKSIEALPNCAKCYWQHARVLFALGKFTEAKQSLDQLLSLNPNSFEGRMLLGKSLYAMHNTAAALEQFKLAGDINPDVIEPNVAVASVYVLAKDWDSARVNWQILQKRASYALPVRVIGFLVLNASGEQQQAKALLEQLPDKNMHAPAVTLTETVKHWLSTE